MSDLVHCPLCGADKGYTLADGSSYRWLSVRCDACGQEVSECPNVGTPWNAPKPARNTAADAAWNEAGAYADRMRRLLIWYADKLKER